MILNATELSNFIRTCFSHQKIKLFKNEPHKKLLNNKWQVIKDLGYPPGSPDLMGWSIITGQVYGVEIKTINDKLSVAQKDFLNLMVADNCKIFIVRQIDKDTVLIQDWKTKEIEKIEIY